MVRVFMVCILMVQMVNGVLVWMDICRFHLLRWHMRYEGIFKVVGRFNGVASLTSPKWLWPSTFSPIVTVFETPPFAVTFGSAVFSGRIRVWFADSIFWHP